MVFRFISDLDQFGFFTRSTLAEFGTMLPFDTLPLYALIHELCYLRGPASQWSADRVMRKFPEFMNASSNSNEPILFTGEMIFRDMFDDYDELSHLKETADILAESDDWPDLYDEEQLARNEVPVYSSTYIDDMYVHFDLSRETASKIKNCKHFITNVMYHNALGAKTEDLMKHLFALRDDVID